MLHARLLFIASSTLLASSLGCSSSSSPAAVDETGTTTETGPTPDSAGETVAETSGDAPGETGAPLSCAAYCALSMTNCTGVNAQFIDAVTCAKMCADFDVGTTADKSGDTLGCRTYHVTVAGTDAASATLHCPHSGPYGGAMCGASRCDDFCKLATANCAGVAGATFADNASCLTECKKETFDSTKGEIDSSPAEVGKTNCTQYHLEAAFGNPALHCAHLSTVTGPCHAP